MAQNDMTDEELAALIDNMAKRGDEANPDAAFSVDDLEVIGATKKAIRLEKKPSRIHFPKFKLLFSSIHSSQQYRTEQNRPRVVGDIWRVALVPSLSVAALVCVMLFSPLSQQYVNPGLGRGGVNNAAIDSLVLSGDYQSALAAVNGEIEERSEGLPGIAFFDRFLSEEDGKRYEASLARAEIYELQWKRIEILSAQGDKSALLPALKKYARTIGYHQQEAQELLKRVEEK